MINKKTAEVLEGNVPGGRVFALFLFSHPRAFRQLMCPHPRDFAHFFKKNAYIQELARVGTAGIDWRITHVQ